MSESASFWEGGSRRDRVIGWSILMGPIIALMLGGLLLLHPESISPATVVGCYEAPSAPWLRITSKTIQIGEPQHRAFRYVAEPSKEGYRLSIEPARSLTPQQHGGYIFKADERGMGYFWPLLERSSDRPGALRHPEDFRGRFVLYARDGRQITYRRTADPQACR